MRVFSLSLTIMGLPNNKKPSRNTGRVLTATIRRTIIFVYLCVDCNPSDAQIKKGSDGRQIPFTFFSKPGHTHNFNPIAYEFNDFFLRRASSSNFCAAHYLLIFICQYLFARNRVILYYYLYFCYDLVLGPAYRHCDIIRTII